MKGAARGGLLVVWRQSEGVSKRISLPKSPLPNISPRVGGAYMTTMAIDNKTEAIRKSL